MDYWSILISAILGAIGAGVGGYIFNKVFKNKNISNIGALIGAILFYSLLKPIIYDNYLKAIIYKSETVKILKKIETSLKDRLPIKIDPITTMEKVKTKELDLKYIYSIDSYVDNKVFKKGFKEVKKNAIENNCNNRLLNELLKRGVVITHVYKLKDNTYTTKVDNNICNSRQ